MKNYSRLKADLCRFCFSVCLWYQSSVMLQTPQLFGLCHKPSTDNSSYFECICPFSYNSKCTTLPNSSLCPRSPTVKIVVCEAVLMAPSHCFLFMVSTHFYHLWLEVFYFLIRG